ncbi:hypothetical protein GCM10010914_26210 [Deinococcus wulumuqiensis]|uniref:Uncharacterized protein n=1 Tax=Deinococcus wulumuqiensis TaxID=980427 RepID=A0AAV4KBX6_9DEIO|nr:hypothetical protein GCM10010914_26210 [Deinococcus wulumuqiensis]GGP31119.1 hypothetical protein GCM10008021_27700 [Deinococcus wulumuqiensis]
MRLIAVALTRLAPALTRGTVRRANRFGFPVATFAKGHPGFRKGGGSGAATLVGTGTAARILLTLRATATRGTGTATAFVLV